MDVAARQRSPTTISPSDRCPTCGRKHKRRSPQNALYWLLLHKMAERDWPVFDEDGKRVGMTRYSPETFHTYYKKRILGADEVLLPSGEALLIPRSTANLDVAEFSTYFDQVQADAAERGVYLDE